jgi:hypothetical protein
MRSHNNASGECDLILSGLRLWVHGREFEDSTDYWDGNWLRVTARCEYPGTCVSVDGPVLHLGELQAFLTGLEALHSTLNGVAKLDTIEPNLRVELVAEKRSHIRLTIEITPDYLQQSHRFVDGIDQTYLPALMAGCRAILVRHPLVGQSR